ncbi:hypothetical protein EEL32_25050 [Brevibacillus laterosporus]|uniref:Uncharacterized protein n=1 Tax=Brevibacillus laterosporus TaxID=1465 RepID=A0A502HLZ2_BRELA|nr:hypothetical protein [Brevibacillus laterosporus]QDX93910.1 hypothetical protein EEL30_17365 [Brevibacillus laterosporus]RAP24052.1 hypothetical protein C2W64_02899 [Brevibacillus laterosporus]TPG67856.1 hypothetical protein EEL31_04255 [Brevibacillus laterosporus]TPG74446.1 hypothetical protein EEL32_25050 [Brevibacillus laterosporus]
MLDSLKISLHDPLTRNKGLDPSDPSNSLDNRSTKQKVIEMGLEYLDGAGANILCTVCIPNGGSCCLGCRFLEHGVGCQQRNTSCTAWLCGFLKFILYEAGLIKEWETFWDQVPGLYFRKDFTPDHFLVYKWLDVPNVRLLSEAFAEDLKELKKNKHSYWLLEIKDTLERYVNKILSSDDPDVTKNMEKKIRYFIKDFKHFHLAKEQLV